ncbi:GntP family permease [Aquimarina sp. I32.4]|uniref:GntP family permease n=1 Tax=Aquimarina sp. I32.4 TaxID=2053903 RepID=UPI000CDEA329|nr:GntP family permease [Aquimarina sp. I32.4]
MLTGIPLLIVIFLAIVFIVVASSLWKLHPFVALLLATIMVGLTVGMPLQTIILSINKGFGGLMGYIGLIVIMGSVIGAILEKSGGAMRIADLVLKLVGKKRPALAMSLIGATVSVPVFCDSGFIILSGLNKALAKQTSTKQATLSLALASGLYTTHTLIPPTPGPIAAAGNIGASDYLGTIMLLGIIISIPVLLVSWIFAKRKGMLIDVLDTSTMDASGLEMPSVFKACMPIALPILLIGIGSMAKFMQVEGGVADILLFLGDPLIALFLGMISSFFLFPSFDKKYLTGWVSDGISLSGPILIITGAGGAFGGVLKATPIADLVGSWVAGGQFSGAVFLIISFLIAALLKTSQGSSTSALVITSSMLAPLMTTMGFDTAIELALVVMALGGGAMTVSHANDSYFWVVSQFSGIKMKDAYRSYTVMTGLQGLVVLCLTLLLYAFVS